MFDPNLGVVEALDGLPEEVVSFFVIVTFLGATSFYILSLSVVYWVWDREKTAFIMGMLIVVGSIILFLKGVIDSPRPPEELRHVEVDTNGFPSGHAAGSVVIWGSVVAVVKKGSFRARAAISSVFVATISFSRLVVGAHYLVDIIGGLLIGGVVLLCCLRYLDSDPWKTFVVGFIFSIPGLAVTESGEAWIVGGIAIGGVVAWTVLNHKTEWKKDLGVVSIKEKAVLVVVGLTLLISSLYSITLVKHSRFAVLGIGSVITVCILLMPVGLKKIPRSLNREVKKVNESK